MEVLFFCKSQPDPLIVGASDIGHGYYGPETGDQVEELNPGPTKDHAARSGNRTLDPQKRFCARPGVQTLDQPKRSFV